jgi:hypothetical protein
MISVRIGEIVHVSAGLYAGARSHEDRVAVDLNGGRDGTADVSLGVSGSTGSNSSAIKLSLDEAQELAALLTNATTRAAVLIAKASEHEQQHDDLTEHQQAEMDDLLKGEPS